MGQRNSTSLKKLAILGSTGSIGQQTLSIVRSFPEKFKVIALAGGRNLGLLKDQVAESSPQYACYSGEADIPIPGKYRKISLNDMAVLPEADIIVMAVSGTAGLLPTVLAAKAGKTIALANKEAIVMAGEILMRTAESTGARILPVDSEPGAIWQCLRGEEKTVADLILTASGGPFLRFTSTRLKTVTAAEALKHPSWVMGKKITIDSATLLNKGLEVIEAHWLFNMPFESIKVVVHSQSIVHSMVEFVDGSVKAQLSNPDMRLPILYALSYPERLDYPELKRLDWSKQTLLNFEPPDVLKFPCFKMAVEAGKQGGTFPAVLCGADEEAVSLFLEGRIKFTDIPVLIEKVLANHKKIENPSLDDIAAAGTWAIEEAGYYVS